MKTTKTAAGIHKEFFNYFFVPFLYNALLDKDLKKVSSIFHSRIVCVLSILSDCLLKVIIKGIFFNR